MKRIIISAFILIGCVLSNVQAQSYKINKQNYDYKMYTPQPGDPNNPTVMGVASFFVPGLGQMLSGEVGRGIGFLGGSLLCGVVTGVGAFQYVDANANKNSFDEFSNEGLGLMLAGAVGALAVNIWSIVDATRVAKVNNMYFQDVRGNLSMVKVELNPFIDTNNYLGQTKTSAGLSLKVTF